MINNRLLCRTARPSNRGGFTLVELLVVIGIIAILAGVALGPITNGIKQAQHNASMQTGRQIGQMEFAYQSDNNNIYPADTTAVAICQDLINASYATDPSVFGVSAQPGLNATKPAIAAGKITLDKSNVSWCFTTLSATVGGGITSTTSDLIPLIFFNNGFQVSPTTPFPMVPGTAGTLGTYGSAAPFGTDGTAIFYKGNNATYLKAGGLTPAGTAGTVGVVQSAISPNCLDTTTYIIAK